MPHDPSPERVHFETSPERESSDPSPETVPSDPTPEKVPRPLPAEDVKGDITFRASDTAPSEDSHEPLLKL